MAIPDWVGDPEREADYRARLEAKLHPVRIRTTIGFAGLYQITYELIKEAVVTQVRQFYMNGFDETGFKYDEVGYRARVKSKDPKSLFRASLLWLVEGEAITTEQADRLDAIYTHRHALTHELLRFIVDPDEDPDVELLVDALAILKALHRFWTSIEFDVGTFDDHEDATLDDVVPLSLAVLQMCVDAYVAGIEEDVGKLG